MNEPDPTRHVKVWVRFQQKRPRGKFPSFWALEKVITLAAVPPPGSYFEYAEGWGLAYLGDGLMLQIDARATYIQGFGPQFSEEEVQSLLALGWGATQ